jgi:hypothetical protein
MPAQCRLVEVKPFRRAREVQLLGDGDEVAELPQVDVDISSSMHFTHQSSMNSPFVSCKRTTYRQRAGFRLVGLASRGLHDEGGYS